MDHTPGEYPIRRWTTSRRAPVQILWNNLKRALVQTQGEFLVRR